MFYHIHHIVLILHHPITFCFDLYKTPWTVKISIMMMISNRTRFSFLLIKTTSFMNVGLWCCLKDGKRLLIKSIVPWKNCLWFSKKNPQLLSCQPNHLREKRRCSRIHVSLLLKDISILILYDIKSDTKIQINELHVKEILTTINSKFSSTRERGKWPGKDVETAINSGGRVKIVATSRASAGSNSTCRRCG